MTFRAAFLLGCSLLLSGACASSGPTEAEINGIAAGHAHRNNELLKVLRGHGVDLAAPRAIDLYFYAPSEGCANAIAAELGERGIAASVTPPDDGFPQWETKGRAQASPQQISDASLNLRFVRTATACGGEYNGWGTDLGSTTGG